MPVEAPGDRSTFQGTEMEGLCHVSVAGGDSRIHPESIINIHTGDVVVRSLKRLMRHVSKNGPLKILNGTDLSRKPLGFSLNNL